MHQVLKTRQFSWAAVLTAVALSACGTDSITGIDPSDPSYAKNGGAGGGGNAHWQENETGYDPATHTFHFKAVGLGKNQSFTIELSANVTTTYDCINPGANLHIPKAFQNIEETITTSATFVATKNGQVTGSVQLDLSAQGTLRCPPPQQSDSDLVGGWTTTGWEASNLILENTGLVTVQVQPGFLPTRTY